MPYPQLRILVVEHDGSTTNTLARLLRREGHDVSCAEDGEAAIAVVRRRSMDLLIADIGLPDISGWDLLPEIRSIQKDIQAIALTGFGCPEDLERSREMGFNTHITKPADWSELQNAVRALFPVSVDRSENAILPENSPFNGNTGGAVL